MGSGKSKLQNLQVYRIRIISGRHNVTGRGARPELIIGSTSKARAPKPIPLRPSNNAEGPWCDSIPPLSALPDGNHVQEVSLPTGDDLGRIEFVAISNNFPEGAEVPEDATWQILRVEIEALVKDGLAIDADAPGNRVVFPCMGWVEPNEVRTFFPDGSGPSHLASPVQREARQIEVESRRNAYQFKAIPGMPGTSRYDDFDELPIDQRPMDAKVAMLVELLDEAQVTLMSCGAVNMLNGRGKKWSSLFFGDNRQGSVFGELYAMKEEARTRDRAMQIAEFCAPNRSKAAETQKVLLGGKVVKLDENGEAATFMSEEELEAEKKRIQEQLERDREERRKAAEARERARIAKATGVSTNETSTADKTTAEKGKGGKVWLKAAEKAGVDVEKVQEKKLSMADLAKIQLSKLNHERYLKSLASSVHIKWFEDDDIALHGALDFLAPLQKEEEAIVEEEEEEEPVSLEEFHKVKSQKKHVQVNKMASKMISENIRNVDAQDWDVEQDAQMAAPFQGAIPLMMRQDRWAVDIEFGRQLLQGCNPHSFRIVKAIPWVFQWLPKEAAEKMIPPGSSIEAEAKEGRVLLMEYTGVDAALSDLGEDAAVTIPDERFFCNPQVLVYVYDTQSRVDNPLRVAEKTVLLPLAIVLKPQIDGRHRIFTPLDEDWTWLLAKAFVGNADAMYTLAVEWYLKTIMIMEPIAISFFRSLPNAHPLYRLLQPFLHDAVASAAATREWFAGDGGFWDRYCSVSLEALEDILRHFYKGFVFEKNAPTAILKECGTEDVSFQYPFREDSLDLWGCIKDLVDEFLEVHYPEEDSCMEDAELQSWFEDLITLGMPMEDGEEGAVPHVATPGFELRSNLAQFVATIIWTTTARNSYLLSHLFDVHGHPVVRPLKLHVPPPLIPGQETSEETLRQALPDVKDESEVVTVAWLIQRGLAARGTALVDFENPLVSSEAEKEVLQRFHERLLEVQRKISLRNTFRNVPYSALMPSHVPVGLGLYRTFDFGQVHLDPLHHKGAAVARASGEAGPGPGTAAAAGPGPSSTGNLPGSGAGGTSAVRTLGKVNSKQTKDMLASVMAASGALRVESSKGPGRATPAIPEGPET